MDTLASDYERKWQNVSFYILGKHFMHNGQTSAQQQGTFFCKPNYALKTLVEKAHDVLL